MTNQLNYPTHTLATAPGDSKAALEQLQKAFGAVPNIAGTTGNSSNFVAINYFCDRRHLP